MLIDEIKTIDVLIGKTPSKTTKTSSKILPKTKTRNSQGNVTATFKGSCNRKVFKFFDRFNGKTKSLIYCTEFTFSKSVLYIMEIILNNRINLQPNNILRVCDHPVIGTVKN